MARIDSAFCIVDLTLGQAWTAWSWSRLSSSSFRGRGLACWKSQDQLHIQPSPVPEFIDPVFAKTSPKRSFSMTENEVYKFGHWDPVQCLYTYSKWRASSPKKFHEVYGYKLFHVSHAFCNQSHQKTFSAKEAILDISVFNIFMSSKNEKWPLSTGKML